MWWRTWLIFWKEFKQISRDPRMIGVAIGLPAIMLVLYGYAFNLDVKHVKLAVYDQDRSRASRDLLTAFSGNEYFDVTSYPGSYTALTRDIDDGRVTVGVAIPVAFSRDLAAGRATQVAILVDGSDATVATTALSYASVIVQQYSTQIALTTLRRNGLSQGVATPVEDRPRFWYNPELKSVYFLVPGLIAMILSSLASLLTSATVARERERGTIETLDVSPVMPIELILGKLFPYVLIALGDVLLVMTVGVLLFHVPLRGSPLLVILASLVFLFTALGIGLYMSVISRTQQSAMTLASLTTQLPTVFLSGFVFPISSMPLLLQLISHVVPATHLIRILRAIFLKGGGFLLVWPDMLVLLVFATIVVAGSALKFKKKL